jgi:HK97 family phage portal protein
MGLIDKLLSRFGYEAKSLDISPELWSAINGGWGLPTKSGEKVSTTTALQQTAYYRGVVAIAEGIAQLPVEMRKELPGGRGSEPAKDHPLYDLLMHQSNNVQDAFQFFRTTLMHAVGAGNGVSYKNILNGQVRELIPVRPECVSIDIDPVLYNRFYDLTFEKGPYVRVGQDQVFHIAGPSWSHYKALDPAVVGREALGLSQVIEASHARLHANSARPSGVLQSDASKLDPDLITRLREQWRQIYQGADKTGEVAILAGGLKWQQLSMTGVDAEHLDTRKHQIEEIARLLGIFPIMLGHAGDQSPTFASASAFLEAHVRYTLQPWIKAIRMAIQTQLLTADERKEGYFVFIDTAELLRGSLKERAEYYKAALGTSSSPGWLNPNEVREDDGWNPDDDPKSDEIIRPFERAPQNASITAGDNGSGKDEGKASTPRTLYVCRKLKNGDELLRWAKAQGFKTTLAADDLHVTIAYSRARVDWMAVPESWNNERDGGLVIAAGGPRVVEPVGDQGAVALKFASTELSWRHMGIREATGASWDYPDYQPHVTITYDAAGVDLAMVEPYRGALRFGPEIFEEIKEVRDAA